MIGYSSISVVVWVAVPSLKTQLNWLAPNEVFVIVIVSGLHNNTFGVVICAFTIGYTQISLEKSSEHPFAAIVKVTVNFWGLVPVIVLVKLCVMECNVEVALSSKFHVKVAALAGSRFMVPR